MTETTSDSPDPADPSPSYESKINFINGVTDQNLLAKDDAGWLLVWLLSHPFWRK